MAASVTPADRPSDRLGRTPAPWNPLRCRGTALPPNVLLAVKLIALCLLLTNHVRLLPGSFLPFIPGLDLVPGAVFQWTLRFLFVGSAVLLLLNWRVRLSSLLLGLSLVVGVVSSRAYYGNDRLFCGLFLVLAGLQEAGREPWLLRYQIVLVYLCAAVNNLFDPDWGSGRFFEFWSAGGLRQAGYIALADWLRTAGAALPPQVLAKVMSWATIASELGLAAGFFVRRFYPWAIWAGVLFHSAMLWFTGSPFTLFFYAMPASYLVFVDWPRSLLVLYDGDCGFCNKTREWISALDFEGLYDWRPYQSGAGAAYGISEEALERRLHVVAEGRIDTGFEAFRKMALYNPVTYFVMAVLLVALESGAPRLRNWLVAAILLFFSPLVRPIGEAAYDWVARNRHRIPPRTCKVKE